MHQEVARRLALLEQRYTSVRRSIVGALESLGRPATIGELLEAVPGLAASSAYRNLALLGRAGVVRRVHGTDDHGRFELSEEVAGEHHHHALCEACGLVLDVHASPALEEALAATARAIAEANGFEVTEHRLELVGRCARCEQAPTVH